MLHLPEGIELVESVNHEVVALMVPMGFLECLALGRFGNFRGIMGNFRGISQSCFLWRSVDMTWSEKGNGVASLKRDSHGCHSHHVVLADEAALKHFAIPGDKYGGFLWDHTAYFFVSLSEIQLGLGGDFLYAVNLGVNEALKTLGLLERLGSAGFEIVSLRLAHL